MKRMKMLRTGLAILMAFVVSSSSSSGQTPEELNTLQELLQNLQSELQKASPQKRVDAEVCAKSVEWILRHQEFYKPQYVESAKKTLELGQERLNQLNDPNDRWWETPGAHALGYRSRVDQSVQPYIVILPVQFKPDRTVRWPLHVVLHGRNGNLTEAHFIASQDGKPAPEDQDWIELHVFGRTNNAYRWAGETDVFEAMDDVIRRFPIDETRVTLWGFSMGGAGAWHLAVHHPSRWVSAGAGAGFVDFYKYQKRDEQLPDIQHQLLTIYDAVDYAENLSIVPMITYGGENDSQLLASLTMKAAAEEAGVPLTVLVGPNMGHKFDDASKEAFMEFLKQHNSEGRNRVPGKKEFQFVTYTLKYNQCEWLTIHEQQSPFERTSVTSEVDDSGALRLETENVAAFSIRRDIADSVVIDDTEFDLAADLDPNLTDLYFVQDEDSQQWQILDYDDAISFEGNPNQHKRHNLQGPVDDAFMGGFVCVTGSGSPWSGELSDYSSWVLDRFSGEFDKWMRAVPQRVDDQSVTEELIRKNNLVLFGDPGSNEILGRIHENLPVQWSRDQFTFDGKTYSTRDHAFVLVYPNPLNPRKYVVLNSGMTMRTKDFKASNSWLFPKIGDYAVVKFSEKEDGSFDETVVETGIFDAHWNK
ncbi:Prolyl oligopeptidase family protein [Thalassoglobus neptunius]|uniref:Prolyl oligopeptidase family protein n=2 Tax=Thalassoglobus neptunius TaxID=1938619 RepID=A0A5C5X6H8_9PLAN|nr:Prolyl oligopeptidase family protein [Thalassoglobus neptunius]